MRKKRTLGLVLVPFLWMFACVGDTSNGNPDASDASNNDVTTTNDGEAGLPTGAKIAFTAPTTTWVPQNGQTQVPFTVTRNNVTGTLTVHVVGLPTGVTAADVSVADGQSNGTLAIAATTASTLGLVTAVNAQLLDQTQVEDQKQIIVGVSGAPGTLDTTWGQNGSAALALANRTIGYTMDVYPASAGANAGKIVVGGVENNSTSDVRLVIARFLPSGQLDTTFGDPAGDGGARTGYVLYDPGTSDDTKFTTYPAAVRIDSKGRIVMFNNRFNGNLAPFCITELGRWTADGDLDASFTRFSAGIDGVYCGSGNDARIMPNDDVAVLAVWNEYEGVESIVQLFSGTDGSRNGNGYHIRLDNSGTNTAQQTTNMQHMAIDKNAGFILVGDKCAGGWNSTISGCVPTIARVTNAGAVDTTFGSSSGYTTFAFGSGLSQTFFGVGTDPSTSDIIAAGRNGAATLGALARVSAAGLPTSFGSAGSLTRDLLGGATSEALFTVNVDSQTRILSVGTASTAQATFVANTRSLANGTADSTYGTGGINATTPGNAEEAGLGIDDRLYVAGYSGTRLVVWRFWP